MFNPMGWSFRCPRFMLHLKAVYSATSRYGAIKTRMFHVVRYYCTLLSEEKKSHTFSFFPLCASACLLACVRACVRACVCVCVRERERELHKTSIIKIEYSSLGELKLFERFLKTWTR